MSWRASGTVDLSTELLTNLASFSNRANSSHRPTSCTCLQILHHRLQHSASRSMAPHAPHGPYMQRSCDEIVRSRQSTLYVDRTSCATVVLNVHGIEGDLKSRLDFRFDLPLLLLASSPSQSRNCSHAGVAVHFRHSTNRTS